MHPPVTVYFDANCSHCREVKKHLEDRGVAYEGRDVTADADAMEELKRMNVPGVPVTVVGSDRVIGFDPARLDQLLASHAEA